MTLASSETSEGFKFTTFEGNWNNAFGAYGSHTDDTYVFPTNSPIWCDVGFTRFKEFQCNIGVPDYTKEYDIYINVVSTDDKKYKYTIVEAGQPMPALP